MKEFTKQFIFTVLSVFLIFSSSMSLSHDKGDIFLRVGPAWVSPNDSSGDLVADNLGNLSTALGTDTGVGVNSDSQLGISFNYMFSDHWAVEVLGASPFHHDISAKGISGLGITKIGSVKQLPPTVNAVYYPRSALHVWQPYIGLGLNYTTFFDQNASSQFESVFGDTKLDLDSSFGLAFQAGLDVNLSDHWSLFATYWYIDIDTSATLKSPSGIGLGVTRIDVNVDIDPSTYMLGLAYKF